jgi:hypothetical protein
MSARHMTLALGTAAGAFLAAGLTSLLSLPVAHADDADGMLLATPVADTLLATPAADTIAYPAADLASNAIVFPGPDTGFIFATDPILKLFGITDIGAANPSEDFEAMILQFPHLGITDVLTSGTESVNDLAQFGVPDDIGLGTAGVTVNTFMDAMHPGLENLFSFTIGFEDPLANLWDFLVANAFFGL